MDKKAEKMLTDAGPFPKESFREKLARQYGIDAVALSGPCEGQNLVDCIVNQLEKRWDRIESRFAGNQDKALKLAIKMAESYMLKDDTEKCIKDLQSLGYKEAAAQGIASYMKAYAMAPAADLEIKKAMGEIYAEEPMDAAPAPADMPPADDGMGGDMGGLPNEGMPADDMGIPADDGMGGEMPPMGDEGGIPAAPEAEGVAPAADAGMGGDTVTIELPTELAEQLSQALEGQIGDMGGMDLDNEMGEPGLEVVVDDGMGGEGMEEEIPGGDLHGEEPMGGPDEVVPGEPAEGIDDHAVEGVEEESAMGAGQPAGAMQMAGEGHNPATCKACGQSMASEGNHGQESSVIQELAKAVHGLESGEKKEQAGEESEGEHEKHEHENLNKIDKEVGDWKKDEGMDGKEEKSKEASSLSSAEKAENKEFGEKVYTAAQAKSLKLAALNMRQGHIRAVGTTKMAYENNYEKKTPKDYNSAIKDSGGEGDIARLNNPMRMNNTDQLLHMDEYKKELGNAKEKNPEAPKPLEDNNVKPEGFTAGGNKFQDGSTMGHEMKFDPHHVEESEWTGGDKSLMGKDESFPKDKPNVPAGSAAIGGEQWEGGNISTKGTVIASCSATITPNGIVVEAADKSFLAPGQIKEAMLPKIKEGLAKITFDGDARKYAEAAVLVIKQASEGESSSGIVDGVTKCDTSKLEGEKFTNDADKKPAEGGAMTGSGKGEDQHKSKDIPTTNTSKLEKEKFTNDAEKKADDDTTTAAAAKETKTAMDSPREKDGPKDYNKAVSNSGDKDVEKPKALEDGNVKPEGFTAGDSKFQDGKTMGHEPKFEAHKVEEKEYTGGDSSLQGKDESFPKDGPKVPAGKGQMGHEPWEGGDLSTKGTTIADNSSKREVSADEVKSKLNDAKVREERLKAASVYCAEMLANGDIRADEYVKTFEKIAEMPVPAIQALIAQAKQMRDRMTKNAETLKSSEGKVGMSVAYVHTANKNEMSLKDRLVAEFKLTKALDNIDEMKK